MRARQGSLNYIYKTSAEHLGIQISFISFYIKSFANTTGQRGDVAECWTQLESMAAVEICCHHLAMLQLLHQQLGIKVYLMLSLPLEKTLALSSKILAPPSMPTAYNLDGGVPNWDTGCSCPIAGHGGCTRLHYERPRCWTHTYRTSELTPNFDKEMNTGWIPWR